MAAIVTERVRKRHLPPARTRMVRVGVAAQGRGQVRVQLTVVRGRAVMMIVGIAIVTAMMAMEMVTEVALMKTT